MAGADELRDASSIADAIVAQIQEQCDAKALVSRAIELRQGSLFLPSIKMAVPKEDCYVFGVGKASFAMYEGLRPYLGYSMLGGLVVSKSEKLPAPRFGFEFCHSDHPIPRFTSYSNGQRLIEAAAKLAPGSLVFFLLSGGASSLIEYPVHDIPFYPCFARANEVMLRAGLDIASMNCIRSRLSKLKSGGLARAFSHCRVVVLVLSDVPGNPLETIGSGPFWPSDAPCDAEKVARDAGIWDALDPIVREGLAKKTFEEPVARPPHVIVGDYRDALRIARDAADRQGLNSSVLAEGHLGPLLELAGKFRSANLNVGECLVAAGEPTLAISGNGRGGRCQHLAALMAREIAGKSDLAFVAVATDGSDGNTDESSVVVNGDSVGAALANGVDVDECLGAFDTYRFHRAAGAFRRRPPGGSNVNDVYVFMRV